MGSRATRTVASLGLRCLRRQLHSARERQQPPVSPGNLAVLSPVISSSPAEALIDGKQEDLWHLQTLLLDPEASRFGRAQQVSMKDFFGECKHMLNASPLKDERNIDTVNGGSFARGIRHLTINPIAGEHDDKAVFGRNLDFLSRYLQCRNYDGSVCSPESQNYPVAAGLSGVDMDGLLSLTRERENCDRSPHLPLSYSSLNFPQEPSMNIPLEASSVKRKRKKKMNKHKQRKLRRRDRHRN